MKKIIAFLATITLSLQMLAGAVVPIAAESEGLTPLVKVDTQLTGVTTPADNLLSTGDLNNKEDFADWNTTSGVGYNWISDDNGNGYVESGIFPSVDTGLKFKPTKFLYPNNERGQAYAGTYKITFYVRSAYEGHLSKMCFMAYDVGGNYAKGADGETEYMNVYFDDQWTKAEFYFTLEQPLLHFVFRPATSPTLLAPFCIDEISLEAVDSIPSDSPVTVGTAYTDAEMQASQANLTLHNESGGKEPWTLEESEKYEVNGLMLNLDNTSHGIGALRNEQDVYDWANQFRGTHITDMIMNIAESKCVYPTDVYFGWYGDPKITKYENGEFTYASNTGNQYVTHFETLGLDYLKTLTTALPEAGINMWLSIRMNDHHDRGLDYSSLFSEYYFEHPEFRRAQYPTKISTGYAKLWDYSFPEIRQIFLELLNESLDRYDVYGYQYEFQRNPYNFHLGGEYAGIDIMNDFMRKTAEIIDIYEEKYGHKIKFCVQVPSDLQTSYDFGLDVMAWVGEGLVDMVSPKGRYNTTHNEMPLTLWKTILDPYGVELAPDIEHRVNGSSTVGSNNSLHNIETYAGTAALYYSQGVDKIQLYNLLTPMSHRFKEQDKISDFDTTIGIPETATSSSVVGWWLVFAHIGSYERLMTMPRTVLLTYNEVCAWWKYTDLRLPATILAGTTSVFRVGMGDIPEGATVTLRFAATGANASNAPTVYINSEKATFVGMEKSPNMRRTVNDVYCYEVPASALGDMFAVAEITPASGSLNIDYMDIHIVPAN